MVGRGTLRADIGRIAVGVMFTTIYFRIAVGAIGPTARVIVVPDPFAHMIHGNIVALINAVDALGGGGAVCYMLIARAF